MGGRSAAVDRPPDQHRLLIAAKPESVLPAPEGARRLVHRASQSRTSLDLLGRPFDDFFSFIDTGEDLHLQTIGEPRLDG